MWLTTVSPRGLLWFTVIIAFTPHAATAAGNPPPPPAHVSANSAPGSVSAVGVARGEPEAHPPAPGGPAPSPPSGSSGAQPPHDETPPPVQPSLHPCGLVGPNEC